MYSKAELPSPTEQNQEKKYRSRSCCARRVVETGVESENERLGRRPQSSVTMREIQKVEQSWPGLARDRVGQYHNRVNAMREIPVQFTPLHRIRIVPAFRFSVISPNGEDAYQIGALLLCQYANRAIDKARN